MIFKDNLSQSVIFQLAVENLASVPIVSLSATISSINVTLDKFRGSSGYEVNSTYPLGSDAIASNRTFSIGQLQSAQIGQSYDVAVNSTYSDGTSSQTTTNIVASAYQYCNRNFGSEYSSVNLTDSLTVHNSTDNVAFAFSATNVGTEPLASFVWSFNDTFHWTQATYDGNPIGPTNLLPENSTTSGGSGVALLQQSSDVTQIYFAWACQDGAMSTMQIHRPGYLGNSTSSYLA